jgi:hypothetical protein
MVDRQLTPFLRLFPGEWLAFPSRMTPDGVQWAARPALTAADLRRGYLMAPSLRHFSIDSWL